MSHQPKGVLLSEKLTPGERKFVAEFWKRYKSEFSDEIQRDLRSTMRTSGTLDGVIMPTGWWRQFIPEGQVVNELGAELLKYNKLKVRYVPHGQITGITGIPVAFTREQSGLERPPLAWRNVSGHGWNLVYALDWKLVLPKHLLTLEDD